MSRDERIQIRASKTEKIAIGEAARKRGRDPGPWLLHLAALADPDVAKAMGVDQELSGGGLRQFIVEHTDLLDQKLDQ